MTPLRFSPKWYGIPRMVPLEDAEGKVDLSLPIEELMAKEDRTKAIQSLPDVRSQMIFLLLEYGFTDREVAANMSVKITSVRAVRQRIIGMFS